MHFVYRGVDEAKVIEFENKTGAHKFTPGTPDEEYPSPESNIRSVSPSSTACWTAGRPATFERRPLPGSASTSVGKALPAKGAALLTTSQRHSGAGADGAARVHLDLG